jgi:hypothetical protein
MLNHSWKPCAAFSFASLVLLALQLGGCKETEEAIESDVTGQVTDDTGQPVAGATVRLYNLLDNTQFVEGSDITSAEAYIDREAVLASSNTMKTAQTGDDGRFRMGAIPTAFLAVATKEGCTAGFAGFDEDTGVLNVDTLIKPDLGEGFLIPTFVLACATAPSGEAPTFEPPGAVVACDEQSCATAGGSCAGDTCVLTCSADACAAAGGTCMAGVCTMASCDATACAAAGGVCAAGGASCELPVCNSDEDCQAGQPGSFCSNPGDVALAECHAPLPGEIVPPLTAVGWTSFTVTDSADNLLADASAANQVIAAADLPADGLVRVQASHGGGASTAYVQVQSGGQSCANAPPRTDYIAADIVEGHLATSAGNYVELALLGGYQKIQVSTSDTLGAGDRSFTVEVGAPCTPPEHAFTAILTWDAGPGEPADLDLGVWNSAGDLVFIGNKQAAWGRLAHEGKGPGPEVFESDDASQGPFTIKVQFFSGKPRTVEGKVRILRTVAGQLVDGSFAFSVGRPKDVAQIGVFESQ